MHTFGLLLINYPTATQKGREFLTQLHYFLSGNTSQGYISLIPETMKQLQYLIVIDGPFSSENGEIMERLYEQLSSKEGLDLQLIHHPSSPQQLQAILLPQEGLGIISSAPSALIDTTDFKGSVSTLNVYDFYNLEIINEHKAAIDALGEQIHKNHQHAYRCYDQALIIHDEWEKIYIDAMDYGTANQFTDQLANQLFPIFGDQPSLAPIHRFLGAATPDGAIDYVPNLTAGLKRYFIKGRPGSGKSTLLRKLVQKGLDQHYELEVYQCGLDPNSLDMIICRQLGFAIFDSTAPHEYFPTEQEDDIIDMYELCITAGTDEKFADELQEISTRYKLQMAEGNAALALAKKFQIERAALTKPALNTDGIFQLERVILQNIAPVISIQNEVH